MTIGPRPVRPRAPEPPPDPLGAFVEVDGTGWTVWLYPRRLSRPEAEALARLVNESMTTRTGEPWGRNPALIPERDESVGDR